MAGSARADRPETEEFPSPNGKWKIVTHWNSEKDICLFDLRDTRSGKVYFDESHKKPMENEGFPLRVNALWSPGSDYVALCLYYGRLLQGVVVIDVTGSEPTKNAVRIPDQFDTRLPPRFCAGAWLNNTDLTLSGEFKSDVDLIVRLTDHKMSVMQAHGISAH